MSFNKSVLLFDSKDSIFISGIEKEISSQDMHVIRSKSIKDACFFLSNNDCFLLIFNMVEGYEKSIDKIRSAYPAIPFLLVSDNLQLSSVLRGMKLGAIDCVNSLSSVDIAYLVSDFRIKKSSMPIACSKNMKLCMNLVSKVADTDATVFLSGESGVGKELISHSIHRSSHRALYPFVPINCGAIPDTLLESILFGHEKGSFTGAMSLQVGKFEVAHKGTLLLDEISEMPLSLQVKLLRVLQEREVERIGAKSTIPIDVRIIATSNRDIRHMVERGFFREDLYYRLNVFPINIPPLRDRKEDICHIAKSILFELVGSYIFFDESALEALCEYHWPGNIRELQNIIYRAVLYSDSLVLHSDMLKIFFHAYQTELALFS